MNYVLFLDDDGVRHARFRARLEAVGLDAIEALRAHEGAIATAFPGSRSV